MYRPFSEEEGGDIFWKFCWLDDYLRARLQKVLSFVIGFFSFTSHGSGLFGSRVMWVTNIIRSLLNQIRDGESGNINIAVACFHTSICNTRHITLNGAVTKKVNPMAWLDHQQNNMDPRTLAHMVSLYSLSMIQTNDHSVFLSMSSGDICFELCLPKQTCDFTPTALG